MSNLKIEKTEGGVVFTAKIVPGSSRTAIAGLLDGMLKVKVSAAPEKGKANKSLIDFLSGKFGIKKTAISIVSGQRNPVKKIQVCGVSAEEILKKLDL